MSYIRRYKLHVDIKFVKRYCKSLRNVLPVEISVLLEHHAVFYYIKNIFECHSMMI